MADIVEFKKGAPMPTNEQTIVRPVDVMKLSDKELVVMFTDASLEMKRRCHTMRDLSMRDDRGRLWSMPALMRHLNQAFTYMTIAFGKEIR